MDQSVHPLTQIDGFGDTDGFSQPKSMGEFLQVQDQLRKAMSAGVAVPSYDGGGTAWQLIPQSIEGTLVTATARAEHCRFFKSIPRDEKRLGATIEEYVIHQSLGTEDLDAGVWQAEGEVGIEVDDEFERAWERVSYLSHIRSLKDPMALMTVLGSPDSRARLNMSGALSTTLLLENASLYGDRDLNPAMPNGLIKMAQAANAAYDCKGEPLDTDWLMDFAAEAMSEPIFGHITDIWIDPQVKADYHKFGASHLHVVQPGNASINTPQGYKAGAAIVGLEGPDGPIPFRTNVFLRPDRLRKTTAIGADAPATPAITSVTAASDAASCFYTGDDGNYTYKIRACGAGGKSACRTTTPGAVAVGEKNTIVITAPETSDVLYYEVFRNEAGGSAFWKIGRIVQATTEGEPSATTFVDKNEWRPNTGCAVMLENSKDVLEYKQLLDFARVPLAKLKLAERVAFVVYGMWKWKLTRRMKLFRNIGRATTPAGE